MRPAPSPQSRAIDIGLGGLQHMLTHRLHRPPHTRQLPPKVPAPASHPVHVPSPVPPPPTRPDCIQTAAIGIENGMWCTAVGEGEKEEAQGVAAADLLSAAGAVSAGRSDASTSWVDGAACVVLSRGPPEEELVGWSALVPVPAHGLLLCVGPEAAAAAVAAAAASTAAAAAAFTGAAGDSRGGGAGAAPVVGNWSPLKDPHREVLGDGRGRHDLLVETLQPLLQVHATRVRGDGR
jgi:hypothetical protein